MKRWWIRSSLIAPLENSIWALFAAIVKRTRTENWVCLKPGIKKYQTQNRLVYVKEKSLSFGAAGCETHTWNVVQTRHTFVTCAYVVSATTVTLTLVLRLVLRVLLLWHWQLWHCCSHCQCHRYDTNTFVASAHVISVAAVEVTFVAMSVLSMSSLWYWLLHTISISFLWHGHFMSVSHVHCVATLVRPLDVGGSVSSAAAIALVALRLLLTRSLLLT